jgi:hypothetical protein
LLRGVARRRDKGGMRRDVDRRAPSGCRRADIGDVERMRAVVADQIAALRHDAAEQQLRRTAAGDRATAVSGDRTLPITGSGLPGLTGIATPSTTSAAAYTGTGLPPLSDCVAIGGVVVLLTSTDTVIGSSSSAPGKRAICLSRRSWSPKISPSVPAFREVCTLQIRSRSYRKSYLSSIT